MVDEGKPMSHKLVSALESVRRRIVRRRWLSAALAIVAATSGAMIALGAVDLAFRISDPGLRWILSACWLTVAALAAYRFGFVDLRNPPTTLDVARQVELQNPQFGDRLGSAIQFVSQSDDDRFAGSAEMRRAVVVDTTAGVEQLPRDAWHRAMTVAPVRRSLMAAAAVGGLVLLAMILNPSTTRLALARLLQPWHDLSWPRVNQLQLASAPTRIAKGQTFEATVKDLRGQLPVDAQIHYRFRDANDREVESFPLQAVGETLLARRENVQRSFDFRVTGGDDDTMNWRTVEVVDPPRLVSFEITTHPPEYTGLPPQRAERHIRILAGTELSAAGATTEPIQRAQIAIADGATLPLEIKPGDGTAGSLLSISNWKTDATIEQPLTTSYRVQLENLDGISGTGDASTLRIDPDSAPEVAWQVPSSDQFVLADAVVPMRVSASDNLAIQNAALLYRVGGDDTKEPQRIEFFTGAKTPPVQPEYLPDEVRDRRELEYVWDLAPLKLEPGTEISVLVEASDYRPTTGRTALPRRIRILTLDEFDSQLADRQTRIVRELEQALALQRSAQQRTRQIELGLAPKSAASRSDVDQLATTGLDQRQISRRLVDPEEGVARELKAVRDDLTNNRLERPELTQQLEQVEAQLSRLGQSALPQAEADINSARKTAESLSQSASADEKDALASSLAGAGQAQGEISSTLERLVDDLQAWSDFQQFAREAGRLLQEQAELRKSTQSAAAEAAKASPSPIQPPEAQRKQLTEQQSELARRLDKLQQAMEQAAPKSDAENSGAVANIADALRQSHERRTAGKLREAMRELQSERLGRAAEVQQQAEEDLQALLDTLRGRAAREPEGLADQLRDSQKQLAELRQELAELDRQAQQQTPDQTQSKQESLAAKVSRAGREMQRSGARSAGQSTQQASDSLQQGADSEQGEQAQQESRDQADQQLADAEAQLQDQIRQLEQRLAARKLDALAKHVDEYVTQQRTLLTDTLRIEDSTKPADTAPLAETQRTLESAVRKSAQEIAEQPVFEMALAATAKDMTAAAEQLAAGKSGRATQQLEHSALTRLGHIADVLRSEANQQQQQEAGGQPAGQGGQGGGQPPSPIDVAELKMLRLLQSDLNQRTRQHEANLAEQGVPLADDGLSTELAEQQIQLADLVDEMNRRLRQPPAPQSVD